MSGATVPDAANGLGAGPHPFADLARKVVLLIGADSFALSHCRALISVLSKLVREVVVVTRSSGRSSELDAPGVSVVDFDCPSYWRNPARETLAVWKFARILEAESPDIVHFVGLKPVALGCLALKLAPTKHAVVHLPDLSLLEPANGRLSRPYRAVVVRLLASLVRKPTSFLLVEVADDLAHLRTQGIEPGARFTVLGGAGIDPDVYPVMPPPQNEMPIAAFVGRMIASNGIDVLMRAFDRLWARGVRLQLELFGEQEAESAQAISSKELARWCLHPGVRCPGRAADVREVWRRAEICVLPTRSRQGMPHALLEAAACGRALIVTDLPGGRNFVRDGVEGFVVPPLDAPALAEALERLARDSSLRQRMGEAARLRVLQSFTEAHVNEALRSAYISLLSGNRSWQSAIQG